MFKIIICVHFKNAYSRMFVEWNFLIIYNCTQFSIKILRMFYNEKVENIFVKSFHVLRKNYERMKKVFLKNYFCFFFYALRGFWESETKEKLKNNFLKYFIIKYHQKRFSGQTSKSFLFLYSESDWTMREKFLFVDKIDILSVGVLNFARWLRFPGPIIIFWKQVNRKFIITYRPIKIFYLTSKIHFLMVIVDFEVFLLTKLF